MKSNTDATFKNGEATSALVIRDERGKLLFLKSKPFCCSSALQAELQTLHWALNLVKDNPISDMERWSDFLLLVNEVDSSFDPSIWSLRHSILECRSILVGKSWNLVWAQRTANMLADFSAKLLASNCVGTFV